MDVNFLTVPGTVRIFCANIYLNANGNKSAG
jgi:hypothetical protein